MIGKKSEVGFFGLRKIGNRFVTVFIAPNFFAQNFSTGKHVNSRRIKSSSSQRSACGMLFREKRRCDEKEKNEIALQCLHVSVCLADM